MNKLFQVLVTSALVLSLGSESLAAARPGGGVSRSGATFKGGFSSQRPAPTSIKPVTPQKSSGFGSFNKAPAPAAPSKSAMAGDLDKNAAQQNAQRSLDARRAAAAPPPAPAPVPGYAQRSPTQAPPPVYYPQPVMAPQQRSGPGWGTVFMGFMLGQAMSNHANASNHNNNSGTPINNSGTINSSGTVDPNGAAGSGSIDSAASSGTVANPVAVTPAPLPETSWFMHVLRFFAWLLIAGLLMSLIVFAVRKYKRLKSERTPRYAFERN